MNSSWWWDAKRNTFTDRVWMVVVACQVAAMIAQGTAVYWNLQVLRMAHEIQAMRGR